MIKAYKKSVLLGLTDQIFNPLALPPKGNRTLFNLSCEAKGLARIFLRQACSPCLRGAKGQQKK
jgi:hypothetical protein